MVLTMTAGTGLIMWLGELVTDKGIGNGMSLLIFTSIASSASPARCGPSSSRTAAGTSSSASSCWASLIIALVVFVEQSQRRIPVQYAKRQVGRRMYGGTSTYIPLKVNMAGVIPVIFASSLLALPVLAGPVQPVAPTATTAGWVDVDRRSTSCAVTTRST